MKNIKNKVLTVASVGVLVAALNITGVFWTFFTTLQPSSTYNCSGYGYQTGYGYGYNCNPINQNDWGFGDARGIDVCPWNIDNSGNFYDRTCDASGSPSSNSDNNSGWNSSSSWNNNSTDENSTNENDDNSTENEEAVEGETEVNNKGDYVTPEYTKTSVIIRAILDDDFNPNYINKFLDIDNSPYKEIIIRFAKAWIIYGTTPTTFEPKRGINRAEFLAIVLMTHSKNFDLGSENTGFPDVDSSSWQAKVVKKWVALGIINGYSDWTFKPNRIISKAEAYGIVSNMGILSSKAVEKVAYTDLEAKWQEDLTKKLEFLKILDPAADNYKFEPNSSVSREEMLNFIYKIISLY